MSLTQSRQSMKLSDIPVASTLKRSEGEIEDGIERYTKWHWSIRPTKVVDWDDPDMPDRLVECGRLIRLHIRPPRSTNKARHPRRERDTMIEFSRAVSAGAHVAFDPDHQAERLYLLIPERARRALAEQLWEKNAASVMSLNQLALVAGSRHGKMRDYPDVEVKPVGILTHIVYYTQKHGDENPTDPRSFYIHQMAEISGGFPILAVDESGRLWICGGSYATPDAGITD